MVMGLRITTEIEHPPHHSTRPAITQLMVSFTIEDAPPATPGHLSNKEIRAAIQEKGFTHGCIGKIAYNMVPGEITVVHFPIHILLGKGRGIARILLVCGTLQLKKQFPHVHDIKVQTRVTNVTDYLHELRKGIAHDSYKFRNANPHTDPRERKRFNDRKSRLLRKIRQRLPV